MVTAHEEFSPNGSHRVALCATNAEELGNDSRQA